MDVFNLDVAIHVDTSELDAAIEKSEQLLAIMQEVQETADLHVYVDTDSRPGDNRRRKLFSFNPLAFFIGIFGGILLINLIKILTV